MRVAGRILCPTGGHGYTLGGECDGPDGVRRTARQQFKEGADFIKITATGGGTVGAAPRHRATFTVAEIAAAVEVADVYDSYVTAHCHSTEGIIRCLDAGVSMLEHATFVDFDGLERLDRDVLARVRDQGVTVVPTVAIHGRWLEQVADRVDTMDDAERALWKRRSEGLARRLDIVAELHSAGVPVLIGSDGGFGRNYPAALDDLAYSIELHVRAGVPAGAAIASATGVAASKIGMGDLVGRVAQGLQADLIAVTGDPERDVTVLAKPTMVMQRGTMVPR
jgi:imidazolonepropionase-like amidohydrolase